MVSILENPLGLGYANLSLPSERTPTAPHQHGHAVMGPLTLPVGDGSGAAQGARNAESVGALGKEEETPKEEEPEDTYNGIYASLLLSGVGFLLPYDSFILAVDYYQERFAGKFDTIVFDMSLTYILCAFVSVAFTNILVRTYSLQARITFGYLLALSVLSFIAYFDIYQRRFCLEDSYKLTLAAVGVVAVGCTVQQSSFYGFTSMLPKRYTQGVMTGESLAGLLISLNRIITKMATANSRLNTLVFFVVSVVVLVVCCVAFQILLRTKFVEHHVGVCRKAAELEMVAAASQRRAELTEELGLVDVMAAEEAAATNGGRRRDSYGGVRGGGLDLMSPTTAAALVDNPPRTTIIDDSGAASLRIPPPRPTGPPTGAVDTDDAGFVEGAADDYAETYVSFPAAMGDEAVVQVSTTQAEALDVEVRAAESLYGSRWSKWRRSISRGLDIRLKASSQIRCHMYSIAMAYFVTLALFPGIESEIKSCNLGSWLPVIVMAAFNLFDFVGKILASLPTDQLPIQIAAFSTARIILIPLIMMCAWPRADPIFKADGWSVFFTSLLGITNGYYGSIPMILAPSKVPDEFKELGGNIMMWSYSVGLTTGSIIAYSLNDILGPKVNLCGDNLNATENPLWESFASNSTDDGDFSPDLVAAEATTESFATIAAAPQRFAASFNESYAFDRNMYDEIG